MEVIRLAMEWAAFALDTLVLPGLSPPLDDAMLPSLPAISPEELLAFMIRVSNNVQKQSDMP